MFSYIQETFSTCFLSTLPCPAPSLARRAGQAQVSITREHGTIFRSNLAWRLFPYLQGCILQVLVTTSSPAGQCQPVYNVLTWADILARFVTLVRQPGISRKWYGHRMRGWNTSKFDKNAVKMCRRLLVFDSGGWHLQCMWGLTVLWLTCPACSQASAPISPDGLSHCSSNKSTLGGHFQNATLQTSCGKSGEGDHSSPSYYSLNYSIQHVFSF